VIVKTIALKKQQSSSLEDYINQLPDDRKDVVSKLRIIIKENLPRDFQETISSGVIGYAVPHETYPQRYHFDPKLSFPFINIGTQKKQ
jgi:hypothetical protein